MALRLYLTANAAPYTPATKRGSWNITSSTLARELGVARAGTSTVQGFAETNATNPYNVLSGRFISEPFQNAGTISGATATVMAKWLESAAAADMFTAVHIYVTTGDSDTPRGTLLSTTSAGAEFAITTNQARGTGALSLSSLAVQAGDRLVVELGFQARNTVTTSYTGTLRYGGTNGVDSTENDTTNARPGYVEFSGLDAIFGRQWSAFSDDFADGVIDTGKWDNWGTTNVVESGGVVTINPGTATGGYFGMDNLYRRNLVGQSVSIQVVNMGTPQAGLGFYPIQLQMSDLNSVYWYIVNGTAFPYKVVQNTYTQLNAGRTHTNGDYYRIREASGTTYWEYSADGNTWSVQYSEANPIPMGLLYLSIFTETTTAISATSVVFDNVNVTPSAGAQSLTLPLITNSSSLYAQTVSVGAVSVSPPLIASTNTMYAPSLSQKADTFTDNFDDNAISPLWYTGNAADPTRITEQNNRLEITHTAAAQYNALETAGVYDLTNSSFYAQFLDTGNQSLVSHESILYININSNNQIWIVVANNTFMTWQRIGGVQSQIGTATAYDSAVHRYFRMRESGGTLYFDYATSPSSGWTNFRSVTNPMALTAVHLALQSGCWQTESLASYSYFDNVNLVGSGPQNVTAPLLTNTSTLYAPVVSQRLDTAQIVNVSQLYAPTLTTGNTIAPPLITSTNVLYGATLTRGSIDLEIGGNLIPNGSFEQNTTWPATGWQTSQPGTIFIASDAYRGARSAAFTVDGSNTNIGIRQSTPNTVLPSTTYILSMMVKSDTAGTMQLSVRDGATITTGNYLQTNGSWGATSVSLNIPTTTGWTEYQLQITTAPGQTTLSVSDLKRSGSVSQAGRTFYIDSVRLYQDVPAYVNSSTMYAPSVAISQSISLPAISNTSTLFGQTITTGAVGLTLPLRSSTAVMYAPTVTTTAPLITLPLISNTSTLYGQTVTVGAVTISPPLIPSTIVMRPPYLSVNIALPSRINNVSVLYPPIFDIPRKMRTSSWRKAGTTGADWRPAAQPAAGNWSKAPAPGSNWNKPAEVGAKGWRKQPVAPSNWN